MATTMRKDTKEKMYHQYLESYEDARSTGNISGVTINGTTHYSRALNYSEFERVLDDKLKDMSSTDKKKYSLGKSIFDEMSSKYTAKQITHFRREINSSLKDLDQTKASTKELLDLVEKARYKSGGRDYVRKEFFDKNIVDIMDLFFAAGGSIGDS